MDSWWQSLSTYWANLVDTLAFDPARLNEPEMIVRLLLQVFLLMGSAFFSGSETSLFSLSRLDLQQLRRKRHPKVETLHALLDHPRQLIISILCGNELINIAAAANMTALLVELYSPGQAGWINVFVMVPLLLLFGEVTPKTIAVSNPVRISAGLVAAPMSLWVKLITPLRWLIRIISDRITTLIVGETKEADNILQVDEFRTLIDAAEEDQLTATERTLIHNLLEAGDTEIVEIMTPRTRTAFLNADLPVPELVEQFKRLRHSRVPVFRGHRDNMLGFIHAEDILRRHMRGSDFSHTSLDDLLHPPIMVPPTKKVDEMFDFFQARNARAAMVLNEFGGIDGFVSMTDVLRFIFGQLSDEARGQEYYRERDEDIYEVPGAMKLTYFEHLSHFGIEDPRMTTIGGVAFRHLDRLPQVGDKVTLEDIVITVLTMDGHRIERVRVTRGVSVDENEIAVIPIEEQQPIDTETPAQALVDEVSQTEKKPEPESVSAEPESIRN